MAMVGVAELSASLFPKKKKWSPLSQTAGVRAAVCFSPFSLLGFAVSPLFRVPVNSLLKFSLLEMWSFLFVVVLCGGGECRAPVFAHLGYPHLVL